MPPLRPEVRPLMRPMFSLLPKPEERGERFGISALLNFVALLLFVALSYDDLPHVKKPRTDSFALLLTTPTPARPRLKSGHFRLVVPRVQLVAAHRQIRPTPNIHRVKPSKQRPHLSRHAARTAKPRRPSAAKFEATIPKLMASKLPAQVKTGVFGNPLGAQASLRPASARMRPPLLGTFGAVSIAKTVDAEKSGVLGGVRSTRFGEGSAGGDPEPPLRTLAKNDTQPVTVIQGVKPAYTPEARAARVQGDVTLRVCFTATRRVEVIALLHSLGHGLDESAENAVRQYRFEPAMRNGLPVDQTTTVHVHFELAA